MVQLAQVLDERRLLHQMTQISGISKHFGIVHESFPKQLLKEKTFASTLTGFVLKSSTKAFASQVNFGRGSVALVCAKLLEKNDGICQNLSLIWPSHLATAQSTKVGFIHFNHQPASFFVAEMT